MSNISIKQNVGEKEMSIKTEMDKMTINQDKMRERIFSLYATVKPVENLKFLKLLELVKTAETVKLRNYETDF